MAQKHIVFDCDGTLISSSGEVFTAIAHVLSEYFKRPISEEEVKEKFDPHLELMNARFGITTPQEAHEVNRIWIEYSKHQSHRFRPFEGIVELLERLQEEGHALYVWTNRDRNSTQLILKNLELARFFWDMRTACCGQLKPHPFGLEDMLPHVNRREVVMIGDTYVDIQGARHYGAHAVAACWCPFVDQERLAAEGAELLAQTPRDFYQFIQTL